MTTLKLRQIVLSIFLSIGLSISGYAQPDLAVTNIEMVGDCKINFTIQNLGQTGVQGVDYSNISVQMSLDGKNWAGGKLGNIVSAAMSTPGGSYTYTHYMSKQVPDGVHSVKVIIDPLNYLPESNESNNERTETFTGNCGVAPPGKPDVQVQDLQLNGNCEAVVTLKNIGTAGVPNSGFFGSALHLYKNNSILASKKLNIVDPGKNLSSINGTVTYTFTGVNIGSGSNSIKVQLNQNFGDSNSLNNNLTKTLACTPQAPQITGRTPTSSAGTGSKPDFTVTNVTMVGGCYVDVTLKNLGPGNAQAAPLSNISVQMYLDGSTWAGKALGNIPAAALANAGGEYTFTKFMNKRVPDGNHTIKAEIDPLNYMNEANESNNEKSTPVNAGCGITPTPAGKPDIKMHDLSLKNCKVQIVLKNIGTAGIPAGNFNGTMVHLYKNNSILASRTLAQVDPGKLLSSVGSTVTYIFQQGADIGMGSSSIKAKVVPNFTDGSHLNNQLTKTLACASPDLTIGNIRAIRTMKGSTKRYSVIVKNIGNGNAPGTFLNVKTRFTGRGKKYRINPLSQGASQTVQVTVEFKTTGRHEIIFHVDPTNRIKESNENNNIKKESVNISKK